MELFDAMFAVVSGKRPLKLSAVWSAQKVRVTEVSRSGDFEVA
jgi:hypothetical protein